MTTTIEMPRFDSIREALKHLADQGDADAQAAYLESLGLRGKRRSCTDCILAVYLCTVVDQPFVEVEPVDAELAARYGPSDDGVSWRGVVKWHEDDPAEPLDPTTNELACRFDEEYYPRLDLYPGVTQIDDWS